LGRTGADERVDLVDERDDVAAGADLLGDLLQALLEVAAVAGAGDERAEVERVELLVLQRLRHVAADDRLGEALHDGGLADAGLADQHGVVLGAARQDLHDALDLLLAPDHGVELVVARGLREVAAELVEDLAACLRRRLIVAADLHLLLALVAGEELDDLLAHAVEVGAQLHEHLGGDALALADEAEQDVLGADVVVAELEGLAEAQLQDLLGARGERDVAGRLLLALADDVLALLADGVQRDTERFQSLGGDPLTLVDQAEQDVLRPDVVVVEHLGLFLGQDDDAASAVGESLEHVYSLATPLQGRRRYIEGSRGIPCFGGVFAGGVTPCQPRRAAIVRVVSGSLMVTSELVVRPLGVSNTVVCGTMSCVQTPPDAGASVASSWLEATTLTDSK